MRKMFSSLESASVMESSRDNDLNWIAFKAAALLRLSSYRTQFTATASESCAHKETTENFFNTDVATDKLKAFFSAF